MTSTTEEREARRDAIERAYRRKYKNVHNTVDVTVVVRVKIACHPDDAESRAEKAVLEELDDISLPGKAVGALLVDTEVVP